MTKLMCPYCGWTYDPSINGDGYSFVPNHRFKGKDCPGQEQTPRNAESDRRPLWRDEQLSISMAPAMETRDVLIREKKKDDETIGLLKQCLSSLACYAATVRSTNTSEWMQSLVGKLNDAAKALDVPRAFVWCKNMANGEMWIEIKDIP